MAEGEKYDVKITILRKLTLEDIHRDYAKEVMPVTCIVGEEGQTYLYKDGNKPEGICPGAWGGLKRWADLLASGADSPYTRESGIAIQSCNDGLHPVIFKLERIED